ncbi:MAG: hypothetical protein ABSB42_17670 [Tepidisphaeraceae bacterium]|jgi:hypothetical protein
MNEDTVAFPFPSPDRFDFIQPREKIPFIALAEENHAVTSQYGHATLHFGHPVAHFFAIGAF